jgi:hypothetical protein
MSDKLDNDLKNRIREVFDHYEDDTADAGWELLRQRFPEEKKRRVIAWWWYSAAAVLLLCLGTWFFYPQTISRQLVSRHKITTGKTGSNQTETIPAKTGEAVAVNKSNAAQSISAQTNTLPSEVNSQPQVNTANSKSPAGTGIAGDKAIHDKFSTTGITGGKASGYKTKAEYANNALTMAALSPVAHRHISKNHRADQSRPEIEIPEKVAYVDLSEYLKTDKITHNLAKVKEQPAIASQTADAADSAASYTATQVAVAQPPAKTQSVVIQKTDPVLKMIAADDARRQVLAKNTTKKSETAKSDRAVIMSLYAATYFNYAKGSQSQVNVGGGFSSDFRISNNFKISTGISIGQNTLSYSSDNIPQQVNAQALAMVNKSAASVATSYNLVTSGLRSVGPDVKDYNASLVGLDIPLNIKYQFNPKKNDTYISAGISSGTYINETYRSTYTNGNNNLYAAANSSLSLSAVNNAVQQTQENTSSQHFSSFDFARTLNVSFGMGYPLGKNRLVIEPFLKYPLSGLGTQDIKFGASGINLKLSFSTSKK